MTPYSQRLTILLLCCFSFTASAQEAVISWVDNRDDEQLNHIKLGQFNEGKWQDAKTIYSSKQSLSTPSAAISQQGEIMAVWSEVKRNKSILLFSTNKKTTTGEGWSLPRVLNSKGIDNLASSVCYDNNNNAWAFWSSDPDGLSDIYFSVYNGSAWGAIKKVNAKNDVPDSQPLANLDKQGDISVEWKQYSYAQERYVTVRKTYKVEPSTSLTKNVHSDKISTTKELTTIPYEISSQRVQAYFRNKPYDHNEIIE